MSNLKLGSSEATATQDLPTDSLRIISIKIADAVSPLIQKSDAELSELYEDWRSEVGTPLYYVMVSTVAVRLCPMSDTAVTNGFEVSYIKAPTQTDPGSPSIQAVLHKYLPYYAVYKMLLGDSANEAQAEKWLMRFLSGVSKAVRLMRAKARQEIVPSGMIGSLTALRESY